MELDDLAKRLLPFSQAHYNDKDISVSNVTKMPGHAGFSYGFTVTTRNREDSWYIRLPPPNVKLEGYGRCHTASHSSKSPARFSTSLQSKVV